MRIAIAQMEMAWTIDANVSRIREMISAAGAARADVVLFPECAITGFHRRVPEQANASAIGEALKKIQNACASAHVAALIGTPLPGERSAESVWNGMVRIDADGRLLESCCKVGLTSSERRYFTPGSDRPVFLTEGRPSAVVFCREIRDVEELSPALSQADVVFWTGAIGWESDRKFDPDDIVTVEIARGFARALDVHLIQCNWANYLNESGSGRMGGSLVVSPDGSVAYRAEFDQPELALIDLDPTGKAEDGSGFLVTNVSTVTQQ